MAKLKKKKINRTLLEMLIGIFAFSLVCQAVVVWFVSDKTGYSIGLWIGTFLACGMALHMYNTLDRALEPGNMEAGKAIQRGSMMRYLVIVLIFAIVMITKITNPLSMFLGLMGLKVAAYIQPFTHKCVNYFHKQ